MKRRQPIRRKKISATEMQLLHVLWNHGAVSVKEAMEQLRGPGSAWAYNTVQTLLTRLVQKGIVVADKEARAHRFRAGVSREEFMEGEVEDLLERLGAPSPLPLVQRLLESHQLPPQEVEELRALLDQMDPPAPSAVPAPARTKPRARRS